MHAVKTGFAMLDAALVQVMGMHRAFRIRQAQRKRVQQAMGDAFRSPRASVYDDRVHTLTH